MHTHTHTHESPYKCAVLCIHGLTIMRQIISQGTSHNGLALAAWPVLPVMTKSSAQLASQRLLGRFLLGLNGNNHTFLVYLTLQV